MDTLSSPVARRQYLMALMYVSGLSKAEIAKRLGYTAQHVSIVVDSPLFREFASELQRELRDSTLGTLTDRIEREAMPSLDVIVGIRDGDFDDHQRAKVQQDAAKFILGDLHMDRRMPKVTKQENDGVLHVSFGPDALKQMLSAQAEVTGETIDVEFEPNEKSATIMLPAPEHRDDLSDPKPRRGKIPKSAKKKIMPIAAQAVNEVLDELAADDETSPRDRYFGEY